MIRQGKEKSVVVLVSALPPPHHGMTVFYEALLRSSFVDAFNIHHIDTSDKRNLDNVGALDIRNVVLGFKNLAELAYACFRYRPEIVYVPNAQNTLGFLRDGLFILIAAITSNARIIMHFHGGDAFQQFRTKSSPLMRWFIRLVLKRVDRAIVLGQRLRYLFANDISDIQVVPNGIEVTEYGQREYRDGKAGVRLSFLGAMIESKGVLDLLKAAVILRHETNLLFELRLAGDWWTQEPATKITAMRMIQEHDLTEIVRFVGRVGGAEKKEFLRTTDILVLPTKNDGFPLVILEAMAAGCAVVSSRGIGAIEDVILDGVSGSLVNCNEPSVLASTICKIAQDADVIRRMGQSGKERYQTLYTFEKCAELMIKALSTDGPNATSAAAVRGW